MADKTKIQWTDATWNIITGCTLVDEGCRNCYAAHLIASWPAIGNHPSRKGLARKNAAGEAKFTGEVRFNEAWLDQPLRWRKPRRIFVCAHGDLFHESVPDEWIDRVFAVMAQAPQHTFQCLTKRPERMLAYMKDPDVWMRIAIEIIEPLKASVSFDIQYDPRSATSRLPLPNVWLGTSISDQASADLRIPALLATPAAVRFISAEPLLGPVNLLVTDRNRHDISTLRGIACDPTDPDGADVYYRTEKLDWIIVGGESGPNARPMHVDWVRSLRDQCQQAGAAFHFKQWGEWAPVVIEQNDSGELSPAYPITGCGDPTAHKGSQPCLFWQGGALVEWPYIKTRQATGARRIGKRAAGRLLDGREWNDMPGVAND